MTDETAKVKASNICRKLGENCRVSWAVFGVSLVADLRLRNGRMRPASGHSLSWIDKAASLCPWDSFRSCVYPMMSLIKHPSSIKRWPEHCWAELKPTTVEMSGQQLPTSVSFWTHKGSPGPTLWLEITGGRGRVLHRLVLRTFGRLEKASSF